MYLLYIGLSPRTRGKLISSSTLPFAKGSIPAHAGETDSCVRWSYRAHRGLSPRTRGKRLQRRYSVCRRATRSIPAHAGETHSARCIPAPESSMVYPRARGGNRRRRRTIYWYCVCGLSPRTRGKLRARRRHYRNRLGSIPAHAGETA